MNTTGTTKDKTRQREEVLTRMMIDMIKDRIPELIQSYNDALEQIRAAEAAGDLREYAEGRARRARAAESLTKCHMRIADLEKLEH